jgi:hypothetical protein
MFGALGMPDPTRGLLFDLDGVLTGQFGYVVGVNRP